MMQEGWHPDDAEVETPEGIQRPGIRPASGGEAGRLIAGRGRRSPPHHQEERR